MQSNKEKLNLLLPILEQTLSANEIYKIGSQLNQDKVFTTDIKKVKRHSSHSPAFLLVEAIETTKNKKWEKYFKLALNKIGFDLLAEVVNEFVTKNNPSLIWLVKHWQGLHKKSPSVLHFAYQYVTSVENIMKCGDMWLLHIMVKVCEVSEENVHQFMQAMFHLFGETPLATTSVSHKEKLNKNEEGQKQATKPEKLKQAHQSDQSTKQLLDQQETKKQRETTKTTDNADGNNDQIQTSSNNKQQETTSAQGDRQPENQSIASTQDLSPNVIHKVDENGNSSVHIFIHDDANDSEERDKVVDQGAKSLTRTTNANAGHRQDTASNFTNGSSRAHSVTNQKDKNGNDQKHGSKTMSNEKTSCEETEKMEVETDNKDSTNHKTEASKDSNGHDHNLRSRVVTKHTNTGSSKMEVDIDKKDTPDFGVEGNKGYVVELRMLVDISSEAPKNAHFYLYANSMENFIPLSSFHQSPCHFYVKLPLHKTSLIYKYLWCDGKGEKHWEKLPGGSYSIVNREVNFTQERVDSGHVILYDVVNFSSDQIYAKSEFRSMYARNMMLHLPTIGQMQFGECNSEKLHFGSFYKCVEEWWVYAMRGVKFDTKSPGFKHTEIAASCKSLIKVYLESNALYGNETAVDAQTSTDIGQRVLAMLAVVMVFNKNDYKFRDERKSLRKGLCVSKMCENDLKTLFEEVSQHGSKMQENIFNALDSVIVSSKIDTLWLVPLYYVMSNNGMCAYDEKIWNDVVAKFKLDEIQKNTKSKTEALSDTTPVFLSLSKTFPKLMDVYLQVVTCQTLLHYINIGASPSTCLDCGEFLLKLAKEVIYPSDFNKFIDSDKFVNWTMDYLAKLAVQCEKVSGSGAEKQFKLVESLAEATTTLLKNINFIPNNYRRAERCLAIVLQVQNCWTHLSIIQPNAKTQLHKQTPCILQTVLKWLESDNSTYVSDEHIQFWNFLFSAKILDEELCEQWTAQFAFAVQELIYKKLRRDDAILNRFQNLQKMKAEKQVEACFSEAVYQYAKDSLKNDGKWFESFFGIFTTKTSLEPVLQRLFSDKWNSLEGRNYQKVLKFVLQWPFAVHFFKLFDQEDLRKLLKKDIQKTMVYIKKSLLDIISLITNREILYQDLQLICADTKQFVEVVTISKNMLQDGGSSVDAVANIRRILDARVLEIKEFDNLKECCKYFLDLCNSSGDYFDTTQLKQALESDVSQKCWCEICEIPEENESDDMNIRLFNLSLHAKNAIKEISHYKIQDTDLIRQIWMAEAVKLSQTQFEDSEENAELQINDVDVVWRITKQRISLLRSELGCGGLLLQKVDNLFAQYDKTDFSKLKDDVSKLVTAVYGFPDVEETNSLNDISDGEVEHVDFELKLPVEEEEATTSDAVEVLEGVVLPAAVETEEVESGSFDGINKVVAEQSEDEFKIVDEWEADDDEADHFVQHVIVEDEHDEFKIVDEWKTEDDEADHFVEHVIVGAEDDELLPVIRPFPKPQVLPIPKFGVCNEPSGNESDSLNVSEVEESIDDAIESEIEIEEVKFETDEDQLKYRVDQICNYFTLKHQEKSAIAFYALKQCLQLTGDFKLIDIIQENQNLSQTRPLKCITKNMITASKAIKGITDEKVELIYAFIGHEDLVTWLRKNMKDRREVKVMSDLAMISAGETTLEVDRVSCFLSAVMGFAPFIFDLQEKADLNDALEAFKKVWETKGRDAKLVEKWNGTAQYLNWLKGIKDFHGSVEKSSLSRAQDINARGVYTIGEEQERMPTVDNSLKLTILALDDTESKTMTMGELRNLQSRLMLIAGEAEKGLDEVKLFVDVLAHVKNLTKAYVKLKLAGCLLFNNWTATLRYVSTSDVSTNETNVEKMEKTVSTIEMRFDEKSPFVLCKEDVLEEMKRLTIVMESFHTRWKSDISDKRSEFYHLNHYNIQQMTYLCKELARVETETDVSDQVYTLLASIKQNVSGKEILELLEKATKAEDETEDIVEEAHQLEENVSMTPVQQKKQMVRRLVDENLSERLAKATVQAQDFPLDYDDCYLKSLDLEYEDDDVVNGLVRNFDKEVGFDANNDEIGVIHSVINDRSNMTLCDVIKKMLNIQSTGSNSASVVVKTICERYVAATQVTSLSDCISTKHLGNFLTSLSTQIDREEIPQRTFHDSLEKGKPNLIICPEQDMFSTLLSIYMHSSNQPLPTISEVLLCSETTTTQEVELLLRRAMTQGINTGSRIYCMASADKLTFEIANAAENMMKQLDKDENINTDYRLVIMCASSQHYIASLLYENRIEYSVRVQQDEIQDYLAQHLRLDGDQAIANCIQGGATTKTSVRVVSSARAGLGKSLHIKRCRARLPIHCHGTTIRLLDKQLDEDDVMNCLYHSKEGIKNRSAHFIHFDVTPSVQHGINRFMFNLLVLGAFRDSIGTLWRRQPSHLYCIEYTKPSDSKAQDELEQRLLNLLPTISCITPREVMTYDENNPPDDILLMDKQEFRSETFQRSYQYLSRYARGENLDRFTYVTHIGSSHDCIHTLLKYCSIQDPTWSELRHFASFLNNQLHDCEQSIFCNEAVVGADSGLSGFKNFVVHFMIRMSQDFATPSLPIENENLTQDRVFELHQLRRRWEEVAHPYLFFNEDRMSMTFVNFLLDGNGNLLHPKTNHILERGIMETKLIQGLKLQNVNLNENFDRLTRKTKLLTLRRVMGLKEINGDPDPTYELTTDNVLKMLAIHMRFRCGIPVVVMGETGCGKTRMVEFMSKLKAGENFEEKTKENVGVKTDENEKVQNMVVVKVHGGITVPIIQGKVETALALANENKTRHNIDTMLFLDEANTTEAIYAIKEFVCDGTVRGEAFQGTGLHIVCACNPYRKHSKEALKNMEESGLGFRVKAEDTTDKLGNLPMRCLVYRVISLPPSMQPLVWDFGQLTNEAEKVYIQQMVEKLAKSGILITVQDTNLIVTVLATSQSFMRSQRKQCCFVSLRDVERCLQSFIWFYNNRKWLYGLISAEKKESFPGSNISLVLTEMSIILRTLIQAIGMCYHVTLEERNTYRFEISQCFRNVGIALSEDDILHEITSCQGVFIKKITLEDNIARNEALRENVYMMVMCTEMRIPLFLIGKPGSSKSLAKTIVTDAMQGPSSRSEIFQRLKQIHILSFQCSAVSDAVGIEAVFTQCAQVQLNQDPEKFVSVVVLDEVGLAEDSPKMPLKVLHPLLEGGTTDTFQNSREENQEKNVSRKRVGFVGISNWALDPAKMNRGIFVHRGDPTEKDLKLTAQGIFSSDAKKFSKDVDQIVKVLTASYLEIRATQEQEFFGLRDYYGVLKMIFSVVNKEAVTLNYVDVVDAIKRNFSGGKTECFKIFQNHLCEVWPKEDFPPTSLRKMIKNNLESVSDCESRFLLLLTNRFAAVNLLDKVVDCSKLQVIFGSSFPRDNDYTELCRNINKIKICMESGCTVVLLNLRDLYESLYDALNQHYVTFADQRYVDLGLGGHRVKCRVARNFRLIVIEDKNVVYDEFPIPLINRLEKYVFTTEKVLKDDQRSVAKRLNDWVQSFSQLDIPLHMSKTMKPFSKQDAFVGYVDDSSASALLSVSDVAGASESDNYADARMTLLNTATMDSVFRLPKSKNEKEAAKLQQMYLHQQSHDSLFSFLKQVLEKQDQESSFATSKVFEVTSFSQILSENDRQKLESALGLSNNSVMLLTLQQFQTQDEFNMKVEAFFTTALTDVDEESGCHNTFILLIQCPQAELCGNLIACARYSVKNIIQSKLKMLEEENKCSVLVAFLYTIERKCGILSPNTLFSFYSSDCTSVHIDELRISVDYIGPPSLLWNKGISEVLNHSMSHHYRQENISDVISKVEQPEYMLDPLALMRTCIPGAMVKLKNTNNENDNRNRVKMLHFLFSKDNIVSRPFTQILLERIIHIMVDRDKVVHPTAWSRDEACSHEALHEGGTFAKTLWLRLRKTVTLAMAKIVSVLDEDNNLDIICGDNFKAQKCELWMKIFKDEETLPFYWKDLSQNPNEFEIRTKENFICHFPFSRKVTEFFMKHWTSMQGDDNSQAIVEFYRKLPGFRLNAAITNALQSKPLDLLKDYAHDLVLLQYKGNHGKVVEYKLIEEVLVKMFEAQHRHDMIHDTAQDNLVAMIFVLFMDCAPNLNQLTVLFNLLPSIVSEEKISSWIKEQTDHLDLVVHIFAYRDVLEHVETQFDNLVQPDYYRKWKDLVQKVVNIKIDCSKVPDTEKLRKIQSEIVTMQKSLAFVELFLNMLIPEGLPAHLFQQYLGILAPLAKRLWKGGKMAGLSSDKFLNIVMKILRGCAEDVCLKLLLSWKDLKCKHCHKPKVVKPIILPCEDFFCESCVKLATVSNIRQCPTCRTHFPVDFPLVPAQLTQAQSKDLDGFKANCTSFFLEYLSTLCFPAPNVVPSNMPFSEHISDALQNLVIGKSSTRAMTPLDMETFDKTPTVRSFILQLMLRYNPGNTTSMLENHFAKVGQVFKSKHELMMIYIRCIEDSLQNRSAAYTKTSLAGVNDFINQLLREMEECLESNESPSQLQVLDVVAKARFIMKVTAKFVHDFCQGDADDKISNMSMVHEVCAFLEDHNLPSAKQYLIKILCRRFGFQVFHNLVESDEFPALIPPEFSSADLDDQASFKSSLFVLGEEYNSIQHILFSVETEDDFEQATENLCQKAEKSSDATTQVLVGVLHWLGAAHTVETKDLRKNFYTKFMANSKTCQGINTRLIALSTKLFSFHDFERLATEKSEGMMRMLWEFVTVACATLLSTNGSVLDDLVNFMTNPQSLQNLFLPTMPQSAYFDVKHIVDQWVDETYQKPPKAYRCPSGHVYFIGDCTNPNQAGVCPECHRAIGGVGRPSGLQPGNVPGELLESSQVGYLLQPANHRPTSATPERNSTRLSVCVMRLFLHASMLVASRNGPYIAGILKLYDAKEAQTFILNQLEKDLLQFSDSLGRSVDDAVLLLHQLMKDMRLNAFVKSPAANLSSMEGRRAWESDFHRCFLASVFQQSDEKINVARQICLTSQKQSQLECLVFEIPGEEVVTDDDEEVDDEEDQDDLIINWHSPFLWKYQIHVTVEHLRQKLEGIVSEEHSDGEVLKKILNETDLSVVQHLPRIVSLQNSLIQRFRRKVDMNDVDKLTIEDYVLEDDRNITEEDFEDYIEIWNKVKGNLKYPNAYDTPKDLLCEEMSLNSPISMCLPSKAGRGSCALALTEYIVGIQNDLLMKFREIMKPQPMFEETSATNMTMNDLICICNYQNLMPLVLANAQYEVTTGETGSKHQIVYRIPALEKQVTEKFVLNRKFIDKQTLPCMVYLQDMGIGEECEAMKKNVEQVPLSHKISQKMDETLAKARLADICEGVRTLTVVISYLAKMGNSPDQILIKYITEDLMVSADEASMVPKASQLRHTLALFERLSWQRSFKFVISGQNPHGNIKNHRAQEEIVDVESVNKSLASIKLPQLQLELNSLILMKQDLEPQSSLRDNLFAYLDEKYTDEADMNWCMKLPDVLEIRHAAHLFRLAVEMESESK